MAQSNGKPPRTSPVFQEAAFGQVVDRIKLCFRDNIHVRPLVVSGGVASNQVLRKRSALSTPNVFLFFVLTVSYRLQTCLEEIQNEHGYTNPIASVSPPPEMCTDNAAMIGWASMYRFLEESTASADPLTIAPRVKWSIEDLHLAMEEGGDGLWGQHLPPEK